MSQQGMCEHWMFWKSADFVKILFHHPLTNCQSAAWSILRPPHFILVSFLELCTQLFTVECQPFQCHKQTSNISVFQCLSSTKRSWKIRRSIVLANLKNSSCALLDLTRSEWFLPRWRSELLLRRKSLNDLTKTKGWWRSGSKKSFKNRFLRHLLTASATGKISKGGNFKGRRSSPLLGNLSATVLLLGSCRPWGGKASRCWECNCNLLQQVHLLLLGHYDHLDRFSFVQWTVRGVSSFVWLEDYGVSTHRDGLDR